MDRDLHTLAVTQGGVFSTKQARACHVSPQTLQNWRSHRVIHRLQRGRYALASAWDAADSQARYLLGLRAALLETSFTASHHAAAALYGLPLFGVDLTRFDVLGHESHHRTRGSLRQHPAPSDMRSRLVGGCFSVPPAFAVCQMAIRNLESGLIAADAALHRNLMSKDDLQATTLLLPRGRVRLAKLVALSDPACESVGETRCRIVLCRLGFGPELRTQVVIREGNFFARVDFMVGSVIVEFDGLSKYSGADGRTALIAEKQREDHLRSLGYGMVRLVWSDLDRPERVAALIRRQQIAAARTSA